MKLAVISIISPNLVDEARVVAVRSILDARGYTHLQKVDPLWVGWSSKLFFNIEQAYKQTDFTHLMYVDARDVVVLASEEEVIERWKKFNHPWVYSAEPFIWSPRSFQPEDYPTPNVVYRYLNSGAYIAERKHLIKWWDLWTNGGRDVPKSLPRGDQDWMAAKFIEHYPEAIQIDTNCDLFQSACGSLVEPNPRIGLMPGKVINNTTGTSPLVIHFNGGDDITRPDRRILWDCLI
ncbi:MAG: hypothetical protein AMJ88_16800 [Anaerolineae bacterium SM23_ 63]|nr:MAG: hypothetical protein AMJ88_16800 [Anaerolineae bacterium SM23_ 63]